MVSWYQASERSRSRADLTRRQVRGALLSAPSSSPSSPYSRPAGGGAGGRRKFGSSRAAEQAAAAAAKMSPLKGRSLRLSYVHGGRGHGGAPSVVTASPTTTAAGSRAVVVPANRDRPGSGASASASASDQDGAEPRPPPSRWSAGRPSASPLSDRRVVLDPLTAEAVKIEVLDLRLPASVYAVARALAGCPQVTLLHGQGRSSDGGDGGDTCNVRPRPGGMDGGDTGLGGEEGEGEVFANNENFNYHCHCHQSADDCTHTDSEEETAAERTDRRIGQLRAALRTLAARVGSVTRVVESWDEARAALSEVVAFPPDGCDCEYEQGGAGGKQRRGVATTGGGAEGGNTVEDDDDLDELEREQRALEQGSGRGGEGGIIVPVPSSSTTTTNKRRRIGTVSSLIHRRSTTTPSSSGKLGRVCRSTKRTITKAVRGARSSSAIAGTCSTARRNFLSKASYAKMLMQRGQLERMRKFKVLTSTVVPPPMVAVVPPPTVGWTMGEEEGAMGGKATEQEEEEQQQQRQQKQREAEAAAQARRARAIAALSGLARLDHLADQRLVEAEQVARARIDAEAARQDAEMAAREQAEEEAAAAAAAQANRASTLLRDLTDDEADIVREAIYGIGRPDEILATSDTDSVQRQSLHKLQPGVWLNDEVIHYFLLMLARRDAELAAKEPGRKRCHFFKSFFITKLLDEAGGYNYKNVKRWSRKVPGKDIFALDKIFFPGECG